MRNFSVSSILKGGVFLSSIFFSTITMAADAAGAGNEIQSLRMVANFIDSVLGRNAVDMFVSSAMPIAGGLNTMASSIAGSLALISLLWSLLLAIVSKKSALSAMMEPIIFSILTALLLANYSMIVTDVVALGQDAISATGQTVGSAFTRFLDVFLMAFINLIVAVMERFSMTWGIFSVVLEAVIALVVLAVAAVLVLIALVDIVAVFLTGPVALGVGVAVGPLFIATLPLGATRRWFDQWLNFIINASMLTALAVIVMVLVQNAILESVTSFMGGETGTIGKVVAIALIASSLSKIFQAIPSFADALFPGRTGAGSAMSQAPGSAIANAAKAGAQAASSAASGAARAAGGMLKAGNQTGASVARKAARQGANP